MPRPLSYLPSADLHRQQKAVQHCCCWVFASICVSPRFTMELQSLERNWFVRHRRRRRFDCLSFIHFRIYFRWHMRERSVNLRKINGQQHTIRITHATFNILLDSEFRIPADECWQKKLFIFVVYLAPFSTCSITVCVFIRMNERIGRVDYGF